MSSPFSIHSSAPNFYSVPSTSAPLPSSSAPVHLQAAREAYEKVQQANSFQAREGETSATFLHPTTTDVPLVNERSRSEQRKRLPFTNKSLLKMLKNFRNG